MSDADTLRTIADGIHPIPTMGWTTTWGASAIVELRRIADLLDMSETDGA